MFPTLSKAAVRALYPEGTGLPASGETGQAGRAIVTLELRGISKSYGNGSRITHVINNIKIGRAHV